MDFGNHPVHVQLAIDHARSLDWVVVGVLSCAVADLPYLARHHAAPELLDISDQQFDVRLDVDHTPEFKAKLLAEAVGTPDHPELEQFFAHTTEMLVVCNSESVAYHTWPRIQLS